MATPRTSNGSNDGTKCRFRTLGQAVGLVLGLVEVAAELDQLGAEGAHGRVLLGGIAVGNEDG